MLEADVRLRELEFPMLKGSGTLGFRGRAGAYFLLQEVVTNA